MTAKTALIVRHVPYEGVAGFREPIERAGYAIDRVDVGTPEFAGVDWLAPDLLVAMGGPMGVYEEAAHPWIADEIAGLATRIAARHPILGVCLGAQLVAAAMGAPVYSAGAREVGFSPLVLSGIGSASPLRHLSGIDVLHWHGDTFDLPADVDHLATSALCANQGFRRGDWLLALQFHAEMGEDPRFGQWLAGSDAYLASAGTDAPRMRADHDRCGPVAVAAGRRMIAEWLAVLNDR